MSHSNTSDDLSFHCQESLTVLICGFSTFCYYASATAFVVSLVPQLHKNSYLKSTKGLSSLWAAGLSTSNLVHTFFVFQLSTNNIYFKIAAIIYCLTSTGILCQFWMYSKQNIRLKVTLFGTCAVVWIAVIAVQIAVPQPRGAEKIEWLAVVLFSVDLLPQIILNILERSTLGQSNIAVVLTTVGRTFEFVPMQIFVTSGKFKFMVYVGAMIDHFNCLQLIWYRQPIPKKKKSIKNSTRKYGTDSGHVSAEGDDDFYAFRVHRSSIASSIAHDDVFTDAEKELNNSVYKANFIGKLKGMAAWQICVGIFEIAVLITLTVVTTSYVGFQWILFVPCLLILILLATKFYRDYKEGTCKCCEDTIDNMQYKMFGESHI